MQNAIFDFGEIQREWNAPAPGVSRRPYRIQYDGDGGGRHDPVQWITTHRSRVSTSTRAWKSFHDGRPIRGDQGADRWLRSLRCAVEARDVPVDAAFHGSWEALAAMGMRG